MRRHVTVAECFDIRADRDAGATFAELAARYGLATSTIRRHCASECWHMPRGDRTIESPDAEALATQLAALADELDRLPTVDEWNRWDESPCPASTVAKTFGSWQAARAAAGLPIIAIDATRPIRAAAYQKPELAAKQTEGANIEMIDK